MLKEKKYKAFWPLPGGTRNYVETLKRALLFVKGKTPSHEEFLDWFKDSFEKVESESTINGYIRVIRKLELVEKEDNKYELSNSGKRYLENEDNKFLFEVLDSRILGFEDLLSSLVEDEKSIEELNDMLLTKFDLGWEENAQTKWRMYWLMSLGLVDYSRSDKKYRLTEEGGEFAKEAKREEKPPEFPEERTKKEKEPEVKEELEKFIGSLQEAQRKSSEPTEFESLIETAFSKLGFYTEHIGGSGETDVLIRAKMGDDEFTSILDAKTTKEGKITNNQIDWDGLEEHKETHEADYIVVVGPGFHGGRLEDSAEKRSALLLKTEFIIEVLRLNSKYPLSLSDLSTISDSELNEEEKLNKLRSRSERYLSFLKLLKGIVEEIRKKQGLEGSLNANALYWIFDEEYSIERIQKALDFLSSEPLKILEKSGKEASEGYKLVLRPDLISRRLEKISENYKHEEING